MDFYEHQANHGACCCCCAESLGSWPLPKVGPNASFVRVIQAILGASAYGSLFWSSITTNCVGLMLCIRLSHSVDRSILNH